MTTPTDQLPHERSPKQWLSGRRVAFVGRLESMPRREAQQLIRASAGSVVERLDASVDLLIVGESELLPAGGIADSVLDPSQRQRVASGELEVVTETELWQRLGLVEGQQSVRRLYTPAMLADLLKVPVAVIRRWHRHGLIVPAREVRRLPYFDFQEAATARRLAELLAAGVSPAAIERKLEALAATAAGRRAAAGPTIGHRRRQAAALAAGGWAGRSARPTAVRLSSAERIGG